MAELVEMGSGKPKPDLLAADRAWLDDCFSYHATDMEKRESLYEVNAAAKEFAETILRHVMPSADRSSALRSVREAKMWASVGIVLNGRR